MLRKKYFCFSTSKKNWCVIAEIKISDPTLARPTFVWQKNLQPLKQKLKKKTFLSKQINLTPRATKIYT